MLPKFFKESIMRKKKPLHARKWVIVAAATTFVLAFSLVFTFLLTLPSFSHANAFASSRSVRLTSEGVPEHTSTDNKVYEQDESAAATTYGEEISDPATTEPTAANLKTLASATGTEPFIKPYRAIISTPRTTYEQTSPSEKEDDLKKTESETEATKKIEAAPSKAPASKSKEQPKATKAKSNPTTAPTKKPTAVTAKPTTAPTTKNTTPSTQKTTEAPAQKATKAPTQKTTEAPTQKATEAPTQKTTAAPTEKATEASKSSSGTHHKSSADDFIKLLNEYRAAQGKGPLQKSSKLTDVACKRAVEITKNFSHDGIKKYGNYGENIFMGSGSNQYNSASYVLGRFKKSSGHDTNQLYDKYKTVGVGHYITDDGAHYWAVVFGL